MKPLYFFFLILLSTLVFAHKNHLKKDKNIAENKINIKIAQDSADADESSDPADKSTVGGGAYLNGLKDKSWVYAGENCKEKKKSLPIFFIFFEKKKQK